MCVSDTLGRLLKMSFLGSHSSSLSHYMTDIIYLGSSCLPAAVKYCEYSKGTISLDTGSIEPSKRIV